MSTSTHFPAEEFPGWSRAQTLWLRQGGVTPWLRQDTAIRNFVAGLGKVTRLRVGESAAIRAEVHGSHIEKGETSNSGYEDQECSGHVSAPFVDLVFRKQLAGSLG